LTQGSFLYYPKNWR